MKMATISVNTEVEVELEVNELLSKAETSDLLEEIRAREDLENHIDEFTDKDRCRLENLYYALRDGNIDEAIKVANPLLDEKIGRQV